MKLIILPLILVSLNAASTLAQPPKEEPGAISRIDLGKRSDQLREELEKHDRERREYNAAHPISLNEVTDTMLERLEKRLAQAAASGDKETTIEGLKFLENYWNQAVAYHNVPAIQRIEAEDFVCTDSSGAVTHKADDLDVAKSGALEVTESKLEDVTVNLLDDTAVLTGKTSFTGRAPMVELAVNGSYRWTDVFTRRDGRWQVVASQATNIEPPAFGKSAGN